mgnify:CR=1 FL=1
MSAKAENIQPGGDKYHNDRKGIRDNGKIIEVL